MWLISTPRTRMSPVGRLSRAWLRATFSLDSKAGSVLQGLPPIFLCPMVRTATLASSTQATRHFGCQPWIPPRASQRRCFTRAVASAGESVPVALWKLATEAAGDSDAAVTAKPASRLPLQCPGCGAFSQTTYADQPGFFDLGRQSTMAYLGLAERKSRVREEDRVVQDALRRIELENGGGNTQLGGLLRGQRGDGAKEDDDAPSRDVDSTILCVRCHDLVHHRSGTPIYHPDIDAIRETIAESPYKYNHIYHVLDAADFPMSLLPRIHCLLDTMPLRSRNRRSQHGKFYNGRLTELSFVITRSDLFAPRRDQVDKLMPWIRETLRDALGRVGRDVRLGNVRCVSARRNWWTTELKEEIWKRGGANWLVGKANVGKSYLVHHVFPKGRMESVDSKRPLVAVWKSESGNYGRDPEHTQAREVYDVELDAEREANLDETGLLPPRPRETNFPQMPVVSALPGTTASPIRIPFGGGKGELIDLPGLARTALLDYVEESHRDSLVMKSHVQPDQVVLKGPWQSLLLGGFIRITPRTPGLVFLTYNFSPLQEHKTMTEKAIAIQAQTSDLRVENIAAAGTGERVALAGSFELKYDVTKLRAGPITRRDAANIRVDRLPYRVVALDLLIEGCGWVEIVAQVRTRHLFNERIPRRSKAKAQEQSASPSTIIQTLDLSEPVEDGFGETMMDTTDDLGTEAGDAGGDGPKCRDGDTQWPVIDVYSPGGKFIGSRRPLNAWVLAQPKASIKKKSMRARPKRSLKGAKRQEKADRRASLEEKKVHAPVCGEGRQG